MNKNWELSLLQRKLLMDRSVDGRIAVNFPDLDVPESPLPVDSRLREDLPLPELSEGEVVRYFTNLSQLNMSIDTSFYPLGSCTMKYNPKLDDEIASLPGFSAVHPLQDFRTTQGALELLYRLQEDLAEITGMDAVSLASVAGAHGELVGMLLMRAYHRSNNQINRRTVLIPDSAHGTNPASAAMAGFNVVSVPSDSMGNMSLEDLRTAAGDDLVGLMITLPSTLGLFDTNILEICRIVHEAGGLVYGDGANMNALLGRVKLGDIGFDIVHLNLHKTFSTPHGGGGPGAGPVAVTQILAPFLPSGIVERIEEEAHEIYRFNTPSKTVGSIGGFHGNFGVLVRAYAYLRLHGADGLRDISENAVINANYLLESLKGFYQLPYDRRCMHEVVFSAQFQRRHGIKALDIAKRLIDYGIHPPTMYFPLIVDEALMIEPTETESIETLDYFVRVMQLIAKEADEHPELLKEAPHDTPNTRLDEARAARQPDLRWKAPERISS
jgi:glycine dehydrogenase subunit 2